METDLVGFTEAASFESDPIRLETLIADSETDENEAATETAHFNGVFCEITPLRVSSGSECEHYLPLAARLFKISRKLTGKRAIGKNKGAALAGKG